jgi:hypothetical protein
LIPESSISYFQAQIILEPMILCVDIIESVMGWKWFQNAHKTELANAGVDFL